MNHLASFSVIKNDLLVVLKQLKTLEKTVKKSYSTVEVTILDSLIQLVIPGVELRVKAQTSGSAKFTIRLWYLTNIVKTEKDWELHFSLTDYQLKLRNFTFEVLTTFFETDDILRGINLPVNYTHIEVAQIYLSGKYTSGISIQ